MVMIILLQKQECYFSLFANLYPKLNFSLLRGLIHF